MGCIVAVSMQDKRVMKAFLDIPGWKFLFNHSGGLGVLVPLPFNSTTVDSEYGYHALALMASIRMWAKRNAGIFEKHSIPSSREFRNGMTADAVGSKRHQRIAASASVEPYQCKSAVLADNSGFALPDLDDILSVNAEPGHTVMTSIHRVCRNRNMGVDDCQRLFVEYAECLDSEQGLRLESYYRSISNAAP
eukprot:TRINITY_DN23884_c0_g1_i2.p1 TRINITY_DN23884_c0_g1~~TRINITY_DN23884_c0_g1_i2.p1  ORF type:complete len:192 (+),score=12.16 TRINITY_DN23884_c0_g1_i2:79-654(+)